jgi:ABC-type glycerol-3-phosphate transport system substrate-binding protein
MTEQRRMTRRDLFALTAAAGGATLLRATPESVTAKVPAPAQAPKTLLVNAYTPSEWTERSAEHPVVVNAPRILAERFQEENPGVQIEWVRFEAPAGEALDTHFATWLTSRVAAGEAPDIVNPLHEIPIQNGWCIPIDDYLAQPSPFAPQYASWKDTFYPSLMRSLVFGDGRTYCAPVAEPFPGVEVGLAYNKEWFDRLGLEPPTTWTEELAVSKALKEAGSGLAPWPPEAKEGNVWPVALQLLVSMLQDDGPKLDLNGDLFVGAEEALPAFRQGLIGPTTPEYRTAWLEMKKIAGYWIDGWATSDLDVLWREGRIGLRTTGAWEFADQRNDPFIEFERGLLPPPYVTGKDVPGGTEPPEFTPGDGKVPADLVTAINGPDTAIMRESVRDHGTQEEAVRWLQWITEPENNAFLVNENEDRIPAAKDAKLGPLFTEIASYKVPKWKYQIAWWGEGLYFDNTHFNELRKIFVAWVTGQMDDETFFDRQQRETAAAADRYEASLKELEAEQE